MEERKTVKVTKRHREEARILCTAAMEQSFYSVGIPAESAEELIKASKGLETKLPEPYKTNLRDNFEDTIERTALGLAEREAGIPQEEERIMRDFSAIQEKNSAILEAFLMAAGSDEQGS